MNIVLHQFKKDILRTRVVAGLWLLLSILQFALIAWNVQPGDTVMQTLYTVSFGLLTFFGILLVVVLVPLLIHQEPLVGTSAFWFTRPLARSELLLSKCLYIFLLLALPIVVQSIVFLANGVTLHDVLLAAPELFLKQFFWIVIVAVLAVLTPNFARFAVLGVILLIVWWICLFFLQMLMLTTRPQAYINTAPSLTTSRELVSELLVLGFGTAAFLVQYLTRHKRLVIALAILGVILALPLQYFWSWDFMKPRQHFVADHGFNAAAVSVSLPAVSNADEMQLRGGSPLKQVNGTLTFPGKPDGYLIKVDSITSSLTDAQGHKINAQAATQQNMVLNPARDVLEAALGGTPVLNLENEYSDYAHPLFNLDAAIYRRLADTSLSYAGTVDCTAYKYVVTTELPLVRGAHYDHGSEHLSITDVLAEPEGVDLMLRRRSIQLEFAPPADEVNPMLADRSDSTVYLLWNKGRQQAVLQKRNTSFNAMGNMQGIWRNEPLRLSFGPDTNNGRDALVLPIDQHWLAGAVLVRLDLGPVAAFQQALVVQDFRLDGKMKSSGPLTARRAPDLAALERLSLPHDASREQVRQYVTDVLVASRLAASEGEHDPQVNMLEQVGAENVDLLIQLARDNHNYYLNHAINKLAQPDQKDMVIQALSTNHDLINTVLDHGWQADARATLLTIFNDKTGSYPTRWLTAIASLQDPTTYPDLKNYFVAQPSEDLLKTLQTLPGFDLAGTVHMAWEKARNGPEWKTAEVLSGAAQFGEPDAVAVALKLLQSSDSYARQQARKTIKRFTPAVGKTDEDLVTWLKSNKASLTFDRQAGKFVLPPAASPAP